jgi:cardiolipin synthase
MHLRIEGSAVRWLQTIFLEDWTYATGDDPRRMETSLDQLLPELPPHDAASGIPVQIVTSGPDNPLEAIHRTHLAAIQSSVHRAWLTTPYFVPGEPALMALTGAALRGVDVRLLVPRRSDSLVVSAAARSYYDELIAAGVKVWEYKARMLHSKTLVVDENCAFVGTANFDNRSFRLNFEVCAIIYGHTLAQPLAAQFETDLLSASAVHAHRHQPFLRRLADAVARLFSPLL